MKFNSIVFKSSITANIILDSEILPTNYDIKIGLDFDNSEPYHQAIGLERINYMINIVFHQSIFVDRNNKMCGEIKKISTTNVAECWDNPWDQFIAWMILYKCNAILSDKGLIDFVTVTGDSGDNLEHTYYSNTISYDLSEDDAEWLRLNQEKHKELKHLWYHRDDLSLNEDHDGFEMNWDSIGLDWNRAKNAISADETPHYNNIKQFKPKIVE